MINIFLCVQMVSKIPSGVKWKVTTNHEYVSDSCVVFTWIYQRRNSSVLMMLCAFVFIFTSGSWALLVVYRSDCRLLPCSIHFFWVYANVFHEKTDKTRKYSKSAIFVWYKMAADDYKARKALIPRKARSFVANRFGERCRISAVAHDNFVEVDKYAAVRFAVKREVY